MKGQILHLFLVICAIVPGVDSFSALSLAPGLRTSTGIPGIQRNVMGSSTRGRKAVSSATATEMCICVNCAYVDRCKAYHFVEEKHEQPHVSENPDFEPRDGSPTIKVFIRKEGLGPGHLSEKGILSEYDVVECQDFVQETGKWAKSMPKGTLLAAGFEPDFVPS